MCWKCQGEVQWLLEPPLSSKERISIKGQVTLLSGVKRWVSWGCPRWHLPFPIESRNTEWSQKLPVGWVQFCSLSIVLFWLVGITTESLWTNIKHQQVSWCINKPCGYQENLTSVYTSALKTASLKFENEKSFSDFYYHDRVCKGTHCTVCTFL